MYVNKCIKCGREFETKNPKRVICPDCLYPDKKMMVSPSNDTTPAATAQPEEKPQYLNGYSAGGTEEAPRYYSAGGNSEPQQRYNRPQRSYNNQGGYQNRQNGGYNRQQGGYNRNQGGYNNNRQGGYNNNGYNRNQGGYGNNRPQRPSKTEDLKVVDLTEAITLTVALNKEKLLNNFWLVRNSLNKLNCYINLCCRYQTLIAMK